MSRIICGLAWTACFVVASLIQTNPTFGQEMDTKRGGDLAAQHCAGCHEATASKGRVRSGRYVPSLREIANAPHYSSVRLRRIIAVPPHRDMTKVPLEAQDISDIAGYIRSLRP